MKILVTGGSGFLGSALIHRLRESGHQARGFSRRPASNAFVGDITNLPDISSAVKDFGPEIIYNLASQTDLAGKSNGYEANNFGVSNLLKAAADSKHVRRIVWLSSQLVNRPGYVPARDDDYDPVGGYGFSKMEGEKIVRANEGGGKEWVIVRPTTVWGPRMSHHYLRLLSLIKRGLYFHVGKDPIYKSYSYIENLTFQMEKLATADRALLHGQTIYAADSQPIEIRGWCDGFAERFGVSIPTLPKAVAVSIARAGDLASLAGFRSVPLSSPRLDNMLTEYVFDTAPIEEICGPSRISNQEGVARTADWWLAAESLKRGA